MNKEFLLDFKKFLLDEITPAVNELGKFESETSRKHIQKLVYTNLIDRFDYTVDKTLLIMIDDQDSLFDEILNMHNEPILEKDVLSLILSKDPKTTAIEKLKNTFRSSTLKKRHALKLQKLLDLTVLKPQDYKSNRVNPSKGKICTSYKPQEKKIPASILGYADWLYSRRNALVHGGGKLSLLDNDFIQLKKLYKITPAKSLKITLSSINNASTFYQDLLSILLDL